MPAVAVFCSGFGAMAGEMVWLRWLATLVGSDAIATSLTLTLFLLGLSLGNWTTCRLNAVAIRPAAMTSQLFLAIFGCVAPFLFPRFKGLYEVVALSFPSLIIPAGTLISMLLLLPFCTALGMAIPLYIRLSPRSPALYYGAANLGGVAGILASAFYLFEKFGLRETLILCALLHGIAAAVAWKQSPPSFVSEIPEKPMPRGTTRRIVLFFVLCNFSVTGLQVLWSRALANGFLEVTLYSFSCVMASAIAGLSAGSLIVSKFKRLNWPLQIWVVGAFTIISTWSILSWLMLPRWDLWLTTLWPQSLATQNWHWTDSLIVEALVAWFPLFVPSLIAGMLFPICLERLPDSGIHPSGAGKLLAWGCLGSAAGALMTGLLFIPTAGLRRTLVLLGLPLLVGSFRFLRHGSHGLRAAWAVSATLLVVAFHRLPPFTTGDTVHNSIVHQELFREESAGAVVQVWQDFLADESLWTKSLVIDGHGVAGTDPTIQADQKLLAHIPLLLHPQPRKVLTVGFGTGGTSYSMSLHPVDVTCFEILPAVVRAAPYFQEVHGDLMTNPAFRLALGDARHLLLRTHERFDVIVSDVTDIHYMGNASLLTKEYFELAKSRLAPEGIFAVWLPRDPGMDALGPIAATFLSVFPRASLWYPYQVNSHFTILIGVPESWKPIPWDTWLARTRAPKIQEDLALIGSADPLRLALYRALDTPELQMLAEGEAIHSDDYPLLDFKAARHAHVQSTDLLSRILSVRPAFDSLIANPRAIDAGDFDQAVQARRHTIGGYLAYANGYFAPAIEAAQEAEKQNPEDHELWASSLKPLQVLSHLALSEHFLFQAQDPQKAGEQLEAVLRLNPNHVSALLNIATLLERAGRPAQALPLVFRANQILPGIPRVQERLDRLLSENTAPLPKANH